MHALSTLEDIWGSALLAEEAVPPHTTGTSLLLPYRCPNYKSKKEEYCGEEKEFSLFQLLILGGVEVILFVGKYGETLSLWLMHPSQQCLLGLQEQVMVQENHFLLAAISSGA